LAKVAIRSGRKLTHETSLDEEGFVFASRVITLAHDPGQRWYYLPEMEPDEVIIVKTYDSEPAMSRFAIHGAFADPTTPRHALPRESIEVRVFAAF
jgi:hypothetical protein